MCVCACARCRFTRSPCILLFESAVIGGGLYITTDSEGYWPSTGSIVVVDVDVVNNTAFRGGGLAFQLYSNGPMVIGIAMNASTVRDNVAGGSSVLACRLCEWRSTEQVDVTVAWSIVSLALCAQMWVVLASSGTRAVED